MKMITCLEYMKHSEVECYGRKASYIHYSYAIVRDIPTVIPAERGNNNGMDN